MIFLSLKDFLSKKIPTDGETVVHSTNHLACILGIIVAFHHKSSHFVLVYAGTNEVEIVPFGTEIEVLERNQNKDTDYLAKLKTKCDRLIEK